MRMQLNRLMVISAALSLLSSSAFASGFMIPEQSVKAMGMSNAVSAIADDASANWFNPAGLAFQADNGGVSSVIVAPQNEYTDSGNTTYQAKKDLHVVPQAYVRLGGNSKMSYGLGINSPFGLSTDWTNSKAPFAAVQAGSAGVTFSEIQAIHVNPNLAYQLSDSLAVAAGVQYYNAFKVHLDNQTLKLGAAGSGLGVNLALMYRSDTLSAGLSYRSKVKIDLTGTAVGGPGMSLLGLNGIGANARTSVTFPDLVFASLSYRFGDQWLLAAQADWINWKTFDAIQIEYDPSALNAATGSSSTIPENWKATTAIRFGAEYALNSEQRLRMGYTFDPTPIDPEHLSPRLPGNDRQLVSLGYGMDISEHMTLDVAYNYVWLKDRTATTPTNSLYHGDYRSIVHLFGVGLTYWY